MRKFELVRARGAAAMVAFKGLSAVSFVFDGSVLEKVEGCYFLDGYEVDSLSAYGFIWGSLC